MAEINIEVLKPGMTLSRNAVHLNGRVLLQAGTTLTPEHLRMLKAWGVFTVSVTDEGSGLALADAPDEAAGDCSDVSQRQLAERFRYSNLSHPLIAELLRYRRQTCSE